jgi:LacI family transcriptional regulator
MKRLRVAVLVHPGRNWGRGILTGIASFARGHRTWSVYHDERQQDGQVPRWLTTWRGDGMIITVENDALADFVRQRGLPTIDLSNEHAIQGVPVIRQDDIAAVRFAFEHLFNLGLRRFAYSGFEGLLYSETRKAALAKLASERGLPLDLFDVSGDFRGAAPSFEADGMVRQTELLEWLDGLEKPLGFVACNDLRALQVMTAVREAGLRVPDDIAVVGFDNDKLVCDLADPPLSSVDLDMVRVGYRAASLLAKLMEGESVPPATFCEPAGIVARQSSDVLAITDPDMAEVARYIQANACRGISVEDVVAAASVSRSTLERRFTKAVGRSVKAEINRVRLRRIMDLLAGTDYKLEAIARMTGFSHAEYMSALFKKFTGMTPGAYRREHSDLVGDATSGD